MKNLKLALLNIKKNFKNEKELKSSFITSLIGMAINNIAFLLLWYYFGKTIRMNVRNNEHPGNAGMTLSLITELQSLCL